MSGKRKKGSEKAAQRAYGRLTRHERDTVQRMLERRASCREIARELGRSPSTVSAEVASHRFVTAPKPRRGERVDAGTDLSAACPRLAAWPRCCNGCGRYRAVGCKRRPHVFYEARAAQLCADSVLVSSRRGIDADEPAAAARLEAIRDCLRRRLSPEQMATRNGGPVDPSPSIISIYFHRLGVRQKSWTVPPTLQDLGFFGTASVQRAAARRLARTIQQAPQPLGRPAVRAVRGRPRRAAAARGAVRMRQEGPRNPQGRQEGDVAVGGAHRYNAGPALAGRKMAVRLASPRWCANRCPPASSPTSTPNRPPVSSPTSGSCGQEHVGGDRSPSFRHRDGFASTDSNQTPCGCRF